MVIKYKAKYIRDGEVVIDDTSLIELGSGNTEKPVAPGVLPKGRDALDQKIAESEERSENGDADDDSASVEK